jgi:esterase
MLAHEALGDGPAALLFLHGILGRGRNWRTLARRFAEARPQWRAVTVDLRGHGDSLGSAPPHDVARAAADLEALDLGVPVRGVLGHSFGGKVALAYADSHRPLDAVWVIDSTPSARPDREGSGVVTEVLEVLEGLPDQFEDRRAFVDAAVAGGLARPVARWLAMNLQPAGSEGFRYGVEMPAVHALLEDYFALDQWAIVERGGVDLVIGGRSSVFSPEDRQRAQGLAQSRVHVLPEAGHWVHADAPDDLLELLVRHTPDPTI